ncbi:MAG: hypothetical protein OXO50_16860 [Caldilineaceae bacterium]|nr:hypothetical protein [Caldilineaceae bacterium]
MKWEDLKKINPFWYIITSLVLVSGWAAFGDKVTTEKIVILFFQIMFMGLGSYGTYLKGELSLQSSSKIRQENFRQQARERYRRLYGLLEEIARISRAIENIQEANLSGIDRSRTINGIIDQLGLVMRSIVHCMDSWRDFAPDELNELHRELIGTNEEE